MTAAPLQVRRMLRTYGKQIGIARRLARHRLATCGVQEGEEAARAARRRVLVEQVAREIVENLLAAGSENEVIGEIRLKLRNELGFDVEIVYPPDELGVRVFLLEEGVMRQARDDEQAAIMARLWEIALETVDDTML
ncbi:MAG: DVU0524 family FlgM-associated protein [Thermodesulfobacteriota bacterium]